ncbi:MAG: M1 family metallopeptidase [Bacteroidia bacterium]|nr:M1 family metallopeptidase [Bacteroidia bacterium]
MKKYLILLAICASPSLRAQNQDIVSYFKDPGAHERDRNIDVTHMKLEVSFVPVEGLVNGTVTHTFRCLQDNVDTVYLDGPGIQVLSATLDGKGIQTRKTETGIVCLTGLKNSYNSTHNLQLVYNAHPKKGLYFIGWKLPAISDPATMSRRQIWTQGQGTDNRYWIPMVDDRSDKYITETIITFDKDYNVLSNGKLIANKEQPYNTRTWHYRMLNQHSGYLLMLAIDKYAVKKSTTKRGTPIQFWYYPEQPQNVEPTSRYTERIIEFLEDEIGVNYQWGSYSNVMVQDFMYGAMENTSATVFGDFFWVDARGYLERNYIGVNAHEATHQWFGDLVTARDDGNHWLQESFATFYPGLFNGSLYGPDETAWYFRGSMNGALAAGEKNSLPVRNSEAGSGRHYPKGASVLYMLYNTMGRENFRRGIKLYLERHAFQNVETWDLQKAMMDATGMNMDWFFDQWIHRGGEPHYKVQWQSVSAGTEFTVEQIHRMEPTVSHFRMPVNFGVYYEDGTEDHKTIWVDKAFQKVLIPAQGKKVAFALFDEGSFILKKITFEKSQQEWKAQLERAKYPLDRYDALLAMAKWPAEDKKEALMAAWKRESLKWMKAEIARQLVQNPAVEANVAAEIAGSPMTEVRRAFVDHASVNETTAPLFEKALSDSSYLIIETALLKLWDYYPFNNKRAAMLEKIKDLDGYIMNLKIRYLELGTEVFPDMKGAFISNLGDYTSDFYGFRVRNNAMAALQRLNACNEKVVMNLFSCLLSFNGRLSNTAKDVLNYFKQQSQYLQMMRTQLEKGNYQPEQKQVIKSALGI